MIKHNPTTLYKVTGSSNKNIDIMKTSTNERLVNGYAKLKSNFVIAAIQNNDAIKAEPNPDKINGSTKALRINTAFSEKESGILPYLPKRHFKTTCPYTVKKIVPKIYMTPIMIPPSLYF